MDTSRIKGLIFISNVHKALEHEWFCEYVNKKEFDFEFILFNSKNSELYHFIIAQGFKCKNYSLKSKFFIPFYILLFYFKLIFTKYDLVHCHLFEASLIGLISSKFAGIKKRIHTRHHSDFHHTYFPNAVKYDLLINKYSTHIIAVSNNIKEILPEHIQKKKNNIFTLELNRLIGKISEKNKNTTAKEEQITSIEKISEVKTDSPTELTFSKVTTNFQQNQRKDFEL